VIAVDTSQARLDAARDCGADAGVLWAGSAEATAEAVRDASGGGVDYAIEATGRGEAMQAAVLSTRTRGTAVLIGIPREDVMLSVPARTIPRMERRIIGSIYGSAYPEHDFLTTLSVYRSGRLPLEKLITHRLPLDDVNQGLELMLSGEATRVVLNTTNGGTP
jgi:Zn-dependent alcohol dehydrogenase